MGPYKLVIEAHGFKKWEGTLTVQAGPDGSRSIRPWKWAACEHGGGQRGRRHDRHAGRPGERRQGCPTHSRPAAQRRQISNLFDLTPGVVGGGNPRTNGMKVGSTEMVLDGMSMSTGLAAALSRMQPGLDTVQEFRIETAGSGAQYLASRHHRAGHPEWQQ